MIKLLPNFLSVLRIFLAMWLFVTIRAHDMVIACWIVFCSGLTDFLDGHLARRFHQISALGGLLDPLADKLFFFSLFTALLLEGIMPFWVFVIFMTRDIFLLAGTAIIKWRRIDYEFSPTMLSKFNTTLQFAFGFIALLWPNNTFLFVLVGMIVVTTILSGFMYLVRFASRVYK